MTRTVIVTLRKIKEADGKFNTKMVTGMGKKIWVQHGRTPVPRVTNMPR